QDLAAEDFIHNNLLGSIETPAFQMAIEKSRISVQNTLSLIAMVRTGRWVTVLPESVVHFMSPDLSFRPIVDLLDRRHVSLLMREKAAFPQFTEELWQFLVQFGWPSSMARNSGSD
ncbi:LysR family transcriptional regulator, partial [Escherichia coli]|nr:LysR family transcriptional regulator [Escherichia coli]